MREIPLSQGNIAIVDDCDFKRVSRYTWYAHRSGNTYYAVRHVWRGLRRMLEMMHRVILDAPDGVEIDHRNGDGLDNRRCNLRLATHAENLRNARKTRGTSRFKGVCWHKHVGKWSARIGVDWHLIRLGYFDNEESAARAYDDAARKYFGAFARTNF